MTPDIKVTMIAYYWDTDSLGDLEGADSERSCARYTELVGEALHFEFPEAEIMVKRSKFSNGGRVDIFCESQEDEFKAVIQTHPSSGGTAHLFRRVDAVIGDIWESGKWLMEAE
jgi:hypothetical protein